MSPCFQDSIREAGLNRYLFEMANIRDQCSWDPHAQPQKRRRRRRPGEDAIARPLSWNPFDAAGGDGSEGPGHRRRTGRFDSSREDRSGRNSRSSLLKGSRVRRKGPKHLPYTRRTDVQSHLERLIGEMEKDPQDSHFNREAHIEKIDGFVGSFKTHVKRER